MSKKDKYTDYETLNVPAANLPTDETDMPQPASTDPIPADPTDQRHGQAVGGGSAGAQAGQPGFFAQRNPKVTHPRGKERRINTVERRAEDRRNMK